jgi:hypothetical protein
VPYVHVVFTLPHTLHVLARRNAALLYPAIFTDILDFCARVLAIQGGKGGSINSEPDPEHGSAHSTRYRAVRFSRRSPRGTRVREARRRNGSQQPGVMRPR